MRSFNGFTTSHLTVFILLYALLFTGCAVKFVQTVPVSPQEEVYVSAAFRGMLENHRKCGCCLDAEADVTLAVQYWLADRSGTMSGFLQAMEPSHIKFVSVNPLGQPLFIFTTDGDAFQSALVPKGKVYEGAVRSAAFEKYVPVWLEPENSFYWFTGRLKPAGFTIDSIARDRDQQAYWLKLQFDGTRYQDMLLFDPQQLVILRHVIMGRRNKPNLDVQYADFQPLITDQTDAAGPGMKQAGDIRADAACRMPGSIRIVSHDNNGQMSLELHSFLPDAAFTRENFMIDIPSGFVRVRVK